MEEQERKTKLKFWITYIYPKHVSEEKEISGIIPNIPEGCIGYEVSYGSWEIKYSSYRVYKGELFSFKEASKILKTQANTMSLLENGKTVAELKKNHMVSKTHLQQKFEEFAKECEQMQIPKKLLESVQWVAPEGVVIPTTDCFCFIYPNDVVVPLKEYTRTMPRRSRSHIAKKTIQRSKKANISKIRVYEDANCEHRIREILDRGTKRGKESGLKEGDFSQYQDIDALPETI